MSRNYIKEAEQNCINICREFQDCLEFLKALEHFGNAYCNEYISENKFFKGLRIIREAVNNEFAEAICRLFLLAGVGGDEAIKYSREQFKKYFSGSHRTAVIQFLDKHGKVPSSYSAETDDEFRRQIQEKLAKQIELPERK